MADEQNTTTRLPGAQSVVREQLPAASGRASTSDIVDRWFQDSFHGTRLGNDTETWNLVHAAKEDLKQRLGNAA